MDDLINETYFTSKIRLITRKIYDYRVLILIYELIVFSYIQPLTLNDPLSYCIPIRCSDK